MAEDHTPLQRDDNERLSSGHQEVVRPQSWYSQRGTVFRLQVTAPGAVTPRCQA